MEQLTPDLQQAFGFASELHKEGYLQPQPAKVVDRRLPGKRKPGEGQGLPMLSPQTLGQIWTAAQDNPMLAALMG
jgi:hypothetical protein